MSTRHDRGDPGAAGPGSAARPGRHLGVDAAVLVLAVAAALTPLVPVFGARALAAPVAGGLAAGSALALVAARRRWSALVTSAAAVGAYLLLGGALAAPATTLAGVVPTLRTLGLLLTGAVSVWKQVLTLDPTLGGGNLLVAPFVLALGGALGAVSLAVRSPGAAAWRAVAVPAGVVVIALLLGTAEPVLAGPVGAVTATGLLLWAAWRRGGVEWRRVPAGLAVVALALGSGMAAGPWLGEQQPRFVLRERIVPPFDPDAQASPLAAFRKFVKEWRDTPLVTVRGLPEGTPVRLAVLDAYDGVVWDVAGSRAAEGSGAFRRVGDTITVSERGVPVTLELAVHHLPFVWLPTVGYAESFTMAGSSSADAVELAAALRYNDATGTAVLVGGVPDGTSWTLDAVVPEAVTAEDIGTAAVADTRLPELSGVPDAARLLAAEVAGTATSPVLIAQALEQGLSGRGWFSHGLTDQGEHPSLSGHGADRITTLLTAETMVGDQEQYASAMALMAREMGLPARVVMGFVAPPDAGAEVTFTGSDVSAWVEIEFAGHGWVPFTPTPERVLTADEERPQDDAEPQPQAVQPPPGPPDPVQVQDEDTEQAGLANDGELTAETPRPDLLVAAAVAVPVLVLAAPLLLVVAAKGRRRRRRRTRGDGTARMVGGWDEVLDHAFDLRLPVPARATRREIAAGLGESVGPEAARAVATLATSADAAVFGPGQAGEPEVARFWAAVDTAIGTLRAAVPRRRRLAARITTRSLRRPAGR